MTTRPRPRHRRLLAVLAVGLIAFAGPVLAGCGGSDDGDNGSSGTTTTEAATTGADGQDGSAGSTTTTATETDEALRVVVTNDDGYAAEGIDAVVGALDALGDVEVEVVAPLDQRSGTGGTFREGPLETEEVETTSGHEAIAVDGYPADTLRVAIDELDLQPHLVVSGINEGQNVGPLVDVSGTVGAARAAVARDIPALAVSSGGPGYDYEAAVEVMLDWIDEHRVELLEGDAPVEVASFNVPSCSTGEVRGVEEVPPAAGGNVGGDQDCNSTEEDPVDDVTAFLNGFATLSIVPDEPNAPPKPGE